MSAAITLGILAERGEVVNPSAAGAPDMQVEPTSNATPSTQAQPDVVRVEYSQDVLSAPRTFLDRIVKGCLPEAMAFVSPGVAVLKIDALVDRDKRMDDPTQYRVHLTFKLKNPDGTTPKPLRYFCHYWPDGTKGYTSIAYDF